MKDVLITNDDGFFSTGVRLLHNVMAELGYRSRIIVASHESSGKAGAVTAHTPVTYRLVHPEFKDIDNCHMRDDVVIRGVNATPVDCVKAGIVKDFVSPHVVKPSLILSGVNSGVNIGPLTSYSATLAAAKEGAMHGIPSVAFSIDDYRFHEKDFVEYYLPHANATNEYSATFLALQNYIKKIIKFVTDPDTSIPLGTYLNVNFPSNMPKAKGIKIVTVNQRLRHGSSLADGTAYSNIFNYHWDNMSIDKIMCFGEEYEDVEAIQENFITITPMQTPAYDQGYANKLLTL